LYQPLLPKFTVKVIPKPPCLNMRAAALSKRKRKKTASLCILASESHGLRNTCLYHTCCGNSKLYTRSRSSRLSMYFQKNIFNPNHVFFFFFSSAITTRGKLSLVGPVLPP
ncbi:hypothetical protein COCCADRAFT_94520, partial [Bipolaris zeicola 26-R-13]